MSKKPSSHHEHSPLEPLMGLSTRQRIIGVIMILIVSCIGIYALSASHAQSPYVSIEAESGTLASPAIAQTNAAASAGKYVQFGTPPTTTSIAASPLGPAAPTGGWHVDLADDFNAPLGTGAGEDNFWYPSQPWNSTPTTSVRGDQGYETEVYNSSQVSVTKSTLVLTAKYAKDVAAATGDGSGSNINNLVQRNYLSGLVSSTTGRAGYTGFNWTPGNGSTWAFEIDARFPVNTGELFNAFWSPSQNTWTNERDFFEGHSSQSQIDSDWIYSTPNTGGFAQNWYLAKLGFDPSTEMHRYTYVVYPNQSWSLYVDGVLQTWVGTNGIGPIEKGDNLPMQLEINYALNATTSGFSAGSRIFYISSVAVYQDNAHAGTATSGGGIAPGTTVK